MSSSDFCVCANEASPGATVLKNAFVKTGVLFFSFLGFGAGLLVLTVFFFDEGGDLVTCDAAEGLVTSGAMEVDGSCFIGDSFDKDGDLVACGADADLVTSGAVEVDGSDLIGDSVRGGGSFARSSSFSSNAVLQKRPLSQ